MEFGLQMDFNIIFDSSGIKGKKNKHQNKGKQNKTKKGKR